MMGGRWYITTIEMTFILKGELSDAEVEGFFKFVRGAEGRPDKVLDVLLNDWATKDVEV